MRELQQQAFATARDVLVGKYVLVENFSPRIAKRLAGGDVLRGWFATRNGPPDHFVRFAVAAQPEEESGGRRN
jgi:hypothetical protein